MGYIDYDSPSRVSPEFLAEHRSLINICGGDGVGRPGRPFQRRAHQLLADELNAYLLTTDP